MNQSRALRSATQRFVRGFGLLASDRTPCGSSLPPVTAHALQVLLEWEQADERPVQQDLADALGLDKSNVTRLCQRLERARYVSRRIDGDDRRARSIALTPKGRQVAVRVEAASDDRFAEILSLISAPRRREVIAALETLADALHCASEVAA